MRTAIVFLTYFDDPESDRAFARLAREARPFGSVIRVRHLREGLRHSPSAATLRLTDSDLAKALPARFEEMLRGGGSIGRGYPDILMLAAARRLAGFHRYWFLEYDVDFSGSWGAFFSQFEDCRADLLCAALHPRALCEDWVHWSWFRAPGDVRWQKMVRGFLPVVRISRRHAEFYAIEARRWAGHAEAVLPSAALNAGFSVEDIGGDGPLVLPGRRGRNYSFSAVHHPKNSTFRALPTVAKAYFPTRGWRLPRGYLWHPVKTAAHKAAKKRLSGEEEKWIRTREIGAIDSHRTTDTNSYLG